MPGLQKTKSILITGATSGIGRALALTLHDLPQKPQVIACGRRLDRLAELKEKGIETRSLELGELSLISGEVGGILESYPELDAVVFNAGIQYQFDFSKPETVSMEDVIKEITINYTSIVTMLTSLLPHFQKRSAEGKESTLIIITSGLALLPKPNTLNYCATKAALHSFTVSLRASLSSTLIRVIEVYPPLVESELHDAQGTTAALSKFWMPLEDFIKEIMPPLLEGQENIPVGHAKELYQKFGEEEKEEIVKARMAGQVVR